MTTVSKIEIKIKGIALSDFEYVSINENIYGIDSFEITCRYDAIEKLDGFLIKNAKDFLGSPVVIQIKVKVGSSEQDILLLKGFVTEIQGSRSGMADNDKIIISGGSEEISLNGKPVTRAFMNKTLEEIVKEVFKQYQNRIKTLINPRDKFSYPYIVQYKESDLEFLKRLSIRYGEWFFFDGDKMIFGELPVRKKDQNLDIGYNLEDFRYQLRVSPVTFSLLSVDPLKPNKYQFKSGSGKVDNTLNDYGKHALVKSKEIFKIAGNDYYQNLNVNEADYQKELEKIGEHDEESDASNLSDLSGSSTNPLITTGMYVKVNCPKQDGSGTTDYGIYLVTSVHHSLDNLLSYSNSFTAVMEKIKIPENTNPYFIKTASNQAGTIADNLDPKKLGRVRIHFPWRENDQIMTPWVNVVTPYTQANSGFYFVPAVKSRVLVGFEGGDVEKPYCFGSLFDETFLPDSAWTGDYNNKDAKVHAIRTVSGQTIELHDESGKEKIRIYDTSNKNEITLDTANGEITIKATEKLTINAKEIEIKAQNGINMEAGQGLELKAMDIKTEAQKGLELKAMEIKTEAQTTLEAKATSVEIKANSSLKATGGATAEVSSSGVMTLKGSMVMIN
jgi:phage protein D